MDCSADPLVHATAFADTGDQDLEIVVEQQYVGHLASGARAILPEGDANVCRPQRGPVVDAVSGHCNDATFLLETLYDLELICRVHAGKGIDVAQAPSGLCT
jgi:hypothetical protein